jgi:hypothetical protein
MHRTIAFEALTMHLDSQEPWKSQLHAVNSLDGLDAQRAEYQRESILWDAYLSQAPGKEARQALERQVEERFKITVVDPDFFVEAETPKTPVQ